MLQIAQITPPAGKRNPGKREMGKGSRVKPGQRQWLAGRESRQAQGDARRRRAGDKAEAVRGASAASECGGRDLLGSDTSCESRLSGQCGKYRQPALRVRAAPVGDPCAPRGPGLPCLVTAAAATYQMQWRMRRGRGWQAAANSAEAPHCDTGDEMEKKNRKRRKKKEEDPEKKMEPGTSPRALAGARWQPGPGEWCEQAWWLGLAGRAGAGRGVRGRKGLRRKAQSRSSVSVSRHVSVGSEKKKFRKGAPASGARSSSRAAGSGLWAQELGVCGGTGVLRATGWGLCARVGDKEEGHCVWLKESEENRFDGLE